MGNIGWLSRFRGGLIYFFFGFLRARICRGSGAEAPLPNMVFPENTRFLGGRGAF